MANVRQIVKNSEVKTFPSDDDVDDEYDNYDEYDNIENENRQKRVFLQVVMFLVMMMFAGVFWGFIEVIINYIVHL